MTVVDAYSHVGEPRFQTLDDGDAARRAAGDDLCLHGGGECGKVVGRRSHPVRFADPAAGRRHGALDGAAANVETGNHGANHKGKHGGSASRAGQQASFPKAQNKL